MNLTFCNTTASYEEINEVPLWAGGLKFHTMGLILSAAFGLFAITSSMYLMFMHATHYLKPWEQRHIIRILFMVPVYSAVSFLSYGFYIHAIYFDILRDCYEAFAIASFFSLLCHYVAADLHDQKEYFRSLQPKPWVWPLTWLRKCCGGERGWTRTPRSGLTWFNIVWFAVFQYCLIRVLCTFVAFGTQLVGRYCLSSLSPAFAHIWVTVIEGICVTVAMFCLVQFYVQLRIDLAEHNPFLKILAIKLVIFLSFWQTIIINFLTSSEVIKPSPQLATPDVAVGVPAMLLCIEMACFSILHLWAYPWKVYDINRSHILASESGPGFPDPHSAYKGGALGWKAFVDAFNPWDLVKAIGRGFHWVMVGRRHRLKDSSYKPHLAGDQQGQEPTGIKPGHYQQLNDNDNDNDNDSEIRAQFQQRPKYENSPYPASIQGDMGAAMGLTERDGAMDQRTLMPGRAGPDTSYHGAYEPRHQAPQYQAYDPSAHDHSRPQGPVYPGALDSRPGNAY